MGLAGTPWCGLIVQGSWEFERSLVKNSLPLEGLPNLLSTISLWPGSMSCGLVGKKPQNQKTKTKTQHHSSAYLSLSWACRAMEEEVGGMVWLVWPPGSEPLHSKAYELFLLATIPANGTGQGCCLQLEAQGSKSSILNDEEHLEA